MVRTPKREDLNDWQVQRRLDDKNPCNNRCFGDLVRFNLLPGNRHDTLGVAPLIEDIEFDAILADKAFDSNWIIERMNERGAKIVISQRPQRSCPLQIDGEIYKWRHLIENFFCKPKDFRAIALRCEKTDRNFKSMIYTCAAAINSR